MAQLPELFEELCVLLLDRGASPAAREIWAGLEELEPSHPTTHLLGGLLDFAAGRYPEAEARYRKVLAVRPDERSVRAFLAESLIAQQRWREAEAILAQLERDAAATPDAAGAEDPSGMRFAGALMEGLQSGLFHRATQR